MSKIICDVCGTSYPETATQCPICGCVRPAEANSVSGQTGEKDGGYTYVKGGRFSKSNVRKRNKANATVSANIVSDVDDSQEKETNKTNKGLVATAVVLLLAIIAVVIYIALRFFMPDVLPDFNMNGTTDTTTAGTTEAVPCEGIKLDVTTVTLDECGEARMLYADLEPAGATDEITFTSSNEEIATVTQEGKVTAVAPGEAIITATCGEFSAQCRVSCVFTLPTEESTEEAVDETTEETTQETTEDTTEDATEDTTEGTTEDTTADEKAFMLNRNDITFSYKDEGWQIYDGSIALSEITWSSDDEAIAKIENGRVIAVGAGITNVHAEYEGEKVSCIIRCSFTDDSENQDVSGNGGETTEDEGGSSSNNTDTGYKLFNVHGNAEDVSITVGYSFSLQLVDANSNNVSGVTWASSDSSCCTVNEGLITGVGAGMAKVTATYNGQTYICIVRVS